MNTAKNHRATSRWASILAFLLLFGCSQVIDLDVDQTGGTVVIYGRITDGTMGNVIYVSRTAAGGGQPEFLSGAEVKVVSEDGDEIEFVEGWREPGIYRMMGNEPFAQVGKSYHMEVQVLGRQYFTSPQEMLPVLGKDTVSWELIKEEDISDTGTSVVRDVVKIYGETSFRELPDEFYVRWGVEETYTILGMVLPRSWFPRYTPEQCYVINNLSEQEAFLLNGTEIRSMELGKRLFATRPIDRSFAVKHYFNIIQSAINKETYDYWSRVNSLTTREGSIFDTPPAPIPGNIRSEDSDEQVFGFFEVADIDTARMFMTNNDIRVFWDDPCERNGEEWLPLFTVPIECVLCLIDEKIVEETCIFCSKLPNSSLTRPVYF